MKLWSRSARPGTLSERGRAPSLVPTGRVYIRAPTRLDETAFTTLMRESVDFHRPWASAPTDNAHFTAYLQDAARADFRAYLLIRSEDHQIVGFFNLSQIVMRLFQSAYLGYAAAARFAGQGYMREGIELVLNAAFVDLGLHRVEANIQPGNAPSLALARGAGFQREGFSPRYLRINGDWRDHERWAILSEDWRARHGL